MGFFSQIGSTKVAAEVLQTYFLEARKFSGDDSNLTPLELKDQYVCRALYAKALVLSEEAKTLKVRAKYIRQTHRPVSGASSLFWPSVVVGTRDGRSVLRGPRRLSIENDPRTLYIEVVSQTCRQVLPSRLCCVGLTARSTASALL